MSLNIFIPGPLALETPGLNPYYVKSPDDEGIDVLTLSKPHRDLKGCAGFGLPIDRSYEHQPVLIATGSGGYLVFTHQLFVHGSMGAIKSPIMGVYPLHGLITYKRDHDPEVVHRLTVLAKNGKSILDYSNRPPNR